MFLMIDKNQKYWHHLEYWDCQDFGERFEIEDFLYETSATFNRLVILTLMEEFRPAVLE